MKLKNKIIGKEVKKYLLQLGLFGSCKIRRLRSGFSNFNFLITSCNKLYNFRTSLKRVETLQQDLEPEHFILKFLETKKINFVPRPVYYENENNIHIVRYIPGRRFCMRHMGERNLKKAIKKLYTINVLAQEYIKYCKKMKKDPVGPVGNSKLLGSIKKDLDFIGDKKEYAFVAIWAKEKIEKDWKYIKTKEDRLYLSHGDPVSNFISSGNGRLHLIDWEYAGLSYEPGLGSIFVNGNLDNEKKLFVISCYAKLSKQDPKKLLEETLKRNKQLIIQGVVYYCAMQLKIKNTLKEKCLFDKNFLKSRMRHYDKVDRVCDKS